MIGRTEILRLASSFKLEPRVVEKDYVLAWVLAGIYRDPELANSWVFKGGTCLKKCYFETHRFSEDLDFTVTDAAHMDQTFLVERFGSLSEWLYNETGIELPIEQLRFDVFENKRGKPQGEARISYRGPFAPRNTPPRIRFDLTADELVMLPATERPVTHPYSDEPTEGIHAQCYAFDELFGEKIRALGDRTRPRDLYDVITLFRDKEFRSRDASSLREIVARKCAFKNLPFPTLAALEPAREELFVDWENMLSHQLPELPLPHSFWDELPAFFEWLGIPT